MNNKKKLIEKTICKEIFTRGLVKLIISESSYNICDGNDFCIMRLDNEKIKDLATILSHIFKEGDAEENVKKSLSGCEKKITYGTMGVNYSINSYNLDESISYHIKVIDKNITGEFPQYVDHTFIKDLYLLLRDLILKD